MKRMVLVALVNCVLRLLR